MENRELSTSKIVQGGGRLNRKNIVVSRPKNALKYAKSPSFDTAINFTHNTKSSRKFYSKSNSFEIKNCSQINNKKHIITSSQKSINNETKFLSLEKNYFISNDKTKLKNNFININLFSTKYQNKIDTNKILNTQNSLNRINYSKSIIDIRLFGERDNQSNLEHKYKSSYKQNELNQNIIESTQTKTHHKIKLLALIFSLFFIFSTLLTSGIFLIVNSVTRSNAILSDNYTSIGDIIDSSDTSKIKGSVYSSLISRLGSNTGTIRTLDGGTPIVFTMAGYDWQVVYRDPDNSDIITVWMTIDYTTNIYDSKSNEYIGSAVQSLLLNFFSSLANSYSILNEITRSPNSMTDNYKAAQDDCGTYNNIDLINGEISTLSDKLWLPSVHEVFTFWGLDNSDRAGINYYSCLRTWNGGIDFVYGPVVTAITANGGYCDYGCGRTYGVRPACHLSLSAMAATISSTVTLDQQGGSGGTSSVTVASGSTMPSITIPIRAGYTFGGYYTGTNGSGTQYYNASGAGTQNWNISGDTTLYACWITNLYTISASINESGTGSISNGSQSTASGRVLEKIYSSDLVYVLPANTSVPVISVVSGLALEVNQKYLLSLNYVATGTIQFDIDFYPDSLPQYNPTATTTEQLLDWEFTPTSTDCASCMLRLFNDIVRPTTYAVTITNVVIYKITSSTTQYDYIYMYNSPISLTATPNADYFFEYWEIDGAVSGTSTTLSFNATANKNIVAHFKLAKTYSYSTAGGEIRLIGNDFQGGTTSTTATYKAVPYAGYYLIGWSVNGEVYKPSGTIYKERTLTLNKADAQGYGICAIFSTDANATPTPSYDVKTGTAISAQLGGEARAVGCDLSTLADSDTATYIAVTDLGYKFDGWYIDGEKVSENLSCRLTKSQVLGKIVEARFSTNNSSINNETNNTDEIL